VVVVLGHADRGSARTGWPAGARVADWVDLPAEIRRCALVVHHAGAGTCWAALTRGVPAVCLPQTADQFRNAGLVAAAGAGVTVPPEVTAVADLQAVFEAAREDADLDAGAARVSRSNAALPDTDALVDRVEAVAGGRTG
jgi:tylactone mycaminosyltransferase/glycosyltransferase DesVII